MESKIFHDWRRAGMPTPKTPETVLVPFLVPSLPSSLPSPRPFPCPFPPLVPFLVPSLPSSLPLSLPSARPFPCPFPPLVPSLVPSLPSSLPSPRPFPCPFPPLVPSLVPSLPSSLPLTPSSGACQLNFQLALHCVVFLRCCFLRNLLECQQWSHRLSMSVNVPGGRRKEGAWQFWACRGVQTQTLGAWNGDDRWPPIFSFTLGVDRSCQSRVWSDLKKCISGGVSTGGWHFLVGFLLGRGEFCCIVLDTVGLRRLFWGDASEKEITDTGSVQCARTRNRCAVAFSLGKKASNDAWCMNFKTSHEKETAPDLHAYCQVWIKKKKTEFVFTNGRLKVWLPNWEVLTTRITTSRTVRSSLVSRFLVRKV